MSDNSIFEKVIKGILFVTLVLFIILYFITSNVVPLSFHKRTYSINFGNKVVYDSISPSSFVYDIPLTYNYVYDGVKHDYVGYNVRTYNPSDVNILTYLIPNSYVGDQMSITNLTVSSLGFDFSRYLTIYPQDSISSTITYWNPYSEKTESHLFSYKRNILLGSYYIFIYYDNDYFCCSSFNMKSLYNVESINYLGGSTRNYCQLLLMRDFVFPTNAQFVFGSDKIESVQAYDYDFISKLGSLSQLRPLIYYGMFDNNTEDFYNYDFNYALSIFNELHRSGLLLYDGSTWFYNVDPNVSLTISVEDSLDFWSSDVGVWIRSHYILNDNNNIVRNPSNINDSYSVPFTLEQLPIFLKVILLPFDIFANVFWDLAVLINFLLDF